MKPLGPLALTDIHSHLVPGVDDGSRTVNDTLEAAGRLIDAGVGRIVTTPHLDGSLSLDRQALASRLDEVDEAFREGSRAIAGAYPGVELARGHEVMLDTPDVDLSDARLRLAGTSFVLIEWPRLRLPPKTGRVIERIRSAGWRPVIAHPERYVGLARHVDSVVQWREAGAYLQVNYGSVVGRYGSEARRVALGLLRYGWADYMASDFHGRPTSPLEVESARTKLAGLGADEVLELLCVTNPGRILDDELPVPVPPLPASRGVWDRMKHLVRPGSE